ncbi:hypothetical protein BH10PSE14_BH10PSE14_27630 [soil metagenome]
MPKNTARLALVSTILKSCVRDAPPPFAMRVSMRFARNGPRKLLDVRLTNTSMLNSAKLIAIRPVRTPAMRAAYARVPMRLIPAVSEQMITSCRSIPQVRANSDVCSSPFVPVSGLSAHLKSFGRRQAYESRGCPNPRAPVGVLWGFRLWAGPGADRRCGYADVHGSRRIAFRDRLRLPKCRPAVFGGHASACGKDRRRARRSPRHLRCQVSRIRAVPDHDACLPADVEG